MDGAFQKDTGFHPSKSNPVHRRTLESKQHAFCLGFKPIAF